MISNGLSGVALQIMKNWILEAEHSHYYRTILKNVSITEGNIEQLELSVRALTCLCRAGIKAVSNLIRIEEDDLRKVRNLGPKALREVIKTIEVLKQINCIL